MCSPHELPRPSKCGRRHVDGRTERSLLENLASRKAAKSAGAALAYEFKLASSPMAKLRTPGTGPGAVATRSDRGCRNASVFKRTHICLTPRYPPERAHVRARMAPRVNALLASVFAMRDRVRLQPVPSTAAGKPCAHAAHAGPLVKILADHIAA